MNPREEARLSKRKNIIDMALTFTAMFRVFEEGSKPKIAEQLENSLSQLPVISNKEQFEKLHADFCNWFMCNIKTREKGEVASGPASYGQAAKVFDVAAKVYVYYCHLPDTKTAKILWPLLYGAIDTPIMKHLKSKYPRTKTDLKAIKSLKSIEKREYHILQDSIPDRIQEEKEFKGQWPVQYEDVMWRRLSRGKAKKGSDT